MSKKNSAKNATKTPTATPTATREASATKTEAKAPKAPAIPPRNPNAQHGPSEQFARLLFRVDRDLWAAIRDHAAKTGDGIQPAMRKLLAKGLGQ
jgi:hypothetical protein